MRRASPVFAIVMSIGVWGCSDGEEVDYLPETMAEESLPAVDTYEEKDGEVDVRATDVGDDAVRVPVG